MAHAELQYLAEADYGDSLRVELAVGNFRAKRFGLLYRITNLNRDCEMARVANTLLFFDYGDDRGVDVPEPFRQLVERQHRSLS